MDKLKKKKLKIALLTSAILAVIFIFFCNLKNKKTTDTPYKLLNNSNSLEHNDSAKISVNNDLSSKSSNKSKLKPSSKNNISSMTLDSKSSRYKIRNPKPSKSVRLESKLVKSKSVDQVVSSSNINAIPKNNAIRPKVHSYSKRFLQIDQDLMNYKVLDGMYYISNTSLNRKKYPSGIIQSDQILIKSKKKLLEASVLENKENGNYSLFTRVVKFKTKKEKGSLLLESLKAYKYKNLNELSMVNFKYELKFDLPADALQAYSRYRNEDYVEWSSIDVVEFVKID